MVPKITVDELAHKLKSQEQFILLDVREAWELAHARIADSRLEARPMSRLAQEGVAALPESARSRAAQIYVLCHHGVRSANVTRWLVEQGWTSAFSVRSEER